MEPVDVMEGQLIRLGQRIAEEDSALLRHPEQADSPEWLGAKVLISTQPVPPPPPGFFERTDLIVNTRHAIPLSWLFFEVRDVFRPYLTALTKYDFFDSLGQAALAHLALHQPEPEDPSQLLNAVLARAFEWFFAVKETGEMIPRF